MWSPDPTSPLPSALSALMLTDLSLFLSFDFTSVLAVFALCSNCPSASCCADKWTMICFLLETVQHLMTMSSLWLWEFVFRRLLPLRALCLPVSFSYWCHICRGTDLITAAGQEHMQLRTHFSYCHRCPTCVCLSASEGFKIERCWKWHLLIWQYKNFFAANDQTASKMYL